LRRNVRDALRGSPRSLAAQRTLARDDNQIEPLPLAFATTTTVVLRIRTYDAVKGLPLPVQHQILHQKTIADCPVFKRVTNERRSEINHVATGE
jgi:hypothetical protein